MCGGTIGDIFDAAGDAIGGAANWVDDNIIHPAGEIVLAPAKWAGDATEWLGKRTGIKEIEGAGYDVGKFTRNPLVERIAGGVTTAAVGNWAAPYINSYMIETFPEYASYFGPAAAGSDSMGTFRVLDAASTGSNFAGTPYAALSGSLTPTSFLDALEDAAIGQAKKLALNKGMEWGLNEFVIKPYQEKLAALMAGLSVAPTRLRSYTYTPMEFTAPDVPAVAAVAPLAIAANAEPGEFVSGQMPGLLGDYLEDYRNYGKIRRPSLEPRRD